MLINHKRFTISPFYQGISIHRKEKLNEPFAIKRSGRRGGSRAPNWPRFFVEAVFVKLRGKKAG